MTRSTIAIIGLFLLAGCSGGGGEESAPATQATAQPPPPDMLVATSDGLWRGKTNGQGELIFARSNFHQAVFGMSEGRVVYHRVKGPTGGYPPDDYDIWTVNTDGTGDRVLVNTNDLERGLALHGPWLVYIKLGQSVDQQTWSLRLDTGAQHFLYDGLRVFSQLYGADRVLFQDDLEISSNALTGGSSVTHARVPDSDTNMSGYGMVVGNHLIFREEARSGFPLLTVPLAGGTPTPLESDPGYQYVGGTLGTRVIYHRCANSNCDVVSVEADGTGKVVLASHPANEAVQGVTTSQVIIRRNLSGNDQLIAVPVAGGPERFLTTMTDSEFVEFIVGDLIIVRRPTGVWSIDLNGTYKKLGSSPGDFGFAAVGNAVCYNAPTILYCAPLDGSGEVRITGNGKVVGML